MINCSQWKEKTRNLVTKFYTHNLSIKHNETRNKLYCAQYSMQNRVFQNSPAKLPT